MTAFNDRVQAFAAKYRLVEQTLFYAKMRRDPFLAVLASALPKDKVAQARAITLTLTHEYLSQADDKDVVYAALASLGDRSDEPMTQAKLDEFLRDAQKQIEHGI